MAVKFDLFSVWTVRLGEREYYGSKIVMFYYKSALVSVFEVDTKNFIEGSLDDSALHFVSLKTAFDNCCLCLVTTNCCAASKEGI